MAESTTTTPAKHDMDNMHPMMIEALSDHMPHIEPNTPPDEAERVRADIEYQKHRERWREDRALALQWRYGDGQ